MNPAIPTPLRTNISNFAGSLSLACWIILLFPQLLEQWRTKSVDGIAFGLLVAWLAGDFFNLFGSVYGGLRPTIVILALWFCLSDCIFLVSYLYYSRRSRYRALMESEQQRLLEDETASGETDEDIPTPFLISTIIPLALVVIIGYANFALSGDSSDQQDPEQRVNLIAQMAGYFSTIFYCAARVPQMVQNHRRKSTQGLSIGFFILSTLGNITYCASICIYRYDKEWMLDYTSWFLGAALAIVEDMIILGQFFYYRH